MHINPVYYWNTSCWSRKKSLSFEICQANLGTHGRTFLMCLSFLSGLITTTGHRALQYSIEHMIKIQSINSKFLEPVAKELFFSLTTPICAYVQYITENTGWFVWFCTNSSKTRANALQLQYMLCFELTGQSFSKVLQHPYSSNCPTCQSQLIYRGSHYSQRDCLK